MPDNPTPPPSSPRVLFEADVPESLDLRHTDQGIVARIRILEYSDGYVCPQHKYIDSGWFNSFDYRDIRNLRDHVLLRALADRDNKIAELLRQLDDAHLAMRSAYAVCVEGNPAEEALEKYFHAHPDSIPSPATTATEARP